MKKRILAMVLAVVLAFTFLPLTAFADGEGEGGPAGTITLGKQAGSPVYGTATDSTYDVEISEGVEGDFDFPCYTDATGAVLCEPPVGIDADYDADKKIVTITNAWNTPAGTYYFALSCGEIQSNIVEYKVGKCPATITSGSATKAYDGTPLTCEDFTTEGFIEGEGVEVTCTGSCTGSDTMTEPATEDNTFTFTAIEGTNLDNYDIKEVYGKLTVADQAFVVVGEDYFEIYDGEAHELEVSVIGRNGIDYTSKAEITYYTSTDDFNWSLTDNEGKDKPSIKDAGTLYVKTVAYVTIGGKTTSQDAYFTMTVDPRTVVLTSASDSKEYDGKPLTCEAMSVGGDGFAGTEGAKFTYSGTQTKVGSTDNEFSYTLDNNTKEKNYSIEKVCGTLTVTPKSDPITIKTSSKTWIYDGQNHSACHVDDWGYYGELIQGDSLSVNFEYTDANPIINAGTYENSLTSEVDPATQEETKKGYTVTDENGEDVTDCYTFAEPIIGTLTIEKRNVTLTSGNDCKVWAQTGDYAENKNVSDLGDGLVAGEELEYTGFQKLETISYTPVKNTFDYAPAQGSNFNPDNYNITVEYGYLMLTDEMSIIGVDQTFMYDGTVHEAGVTLIDNGQGAQVVLTYSTSTDNEDWSDYSSNVPSLKEAGTLYVRAKAIKGVQEKDASYTITVEKRNVIIVSDSSSKQYDGTALTEPSYQILGDGFASEQEGIEYEATGSQKGVGTSDNTFEYRVNSNTNEDNYTIQKEFGTLEVTQNELPIIISTGSRTWAYNGVALSSTEYTATIDGEKVKDGKLLGSDILQVIPTGSITDVGVAENTFEYKVIGDDGEDVTAYYSFWDPVLGTLEVTPRSITITTGSAEKVYDGQPLTNAKYTVSGDGFVAGEGLTAVNVVGSRTNAGTARNSLDSANPYTLNENTKAGNYKIKVVKGTLKVNKRKVTVTSGNAVSTWDACPQAGLSNTAACTVSGDGFVAGEMADGYPKAVGLLAKPNPEPSYSVQSENTIEYKWAGNGNPANYEITENSGVLMIIQSGDFAAVASNYEGIYDGQKHTVNIAAASSSVTIEYSTDNAHWTTTQPEIKDATLNKDGEVESKTIFVRVIDSFDNVAEVSYTVTVYPRELTLTAGSVTEVYTGEALTCEDYTVGGDGFANATEETDANVTTMGTVTDVQYDPAGEIAAVTNLISELSDNGSFKMSNYNIEINSGLLIVTPRQVKLVSQSDTITYDGETHTYKTVTEAGKNPLIISTMGFVEGQGVTYSDFAEIKDAGLYENTFKCKANFGTNLKNYDITYVYGVIKVVPCEITVTSESDSKAYDGKPLTNDKVTVTTSLEGNKLPKGDNVVIKTTGSQTEVGKSANTISVTVPKVSNYKVTKVEGTLTVTKAAVDTGDHNNMALWFILAAAALLTLAGSVFVKKKFN